MRDQGSAILSVLWVVLVLSLVSFSLAAAVRTEVVSSQNSFDSERAFFMAKGAAEIVYNSYAKHLPIPQDSPIRQENGEYIFPFEAGEARVRFDSKAGLIDVNQASDVLLASLFDSVGVDLDTRNRLVDSILDWRDEDDIPHLYGAEVSDYPQNTADRPTLPRNAKFQNIDELLLVKNMTPELFYGSFGVDRVSGEYRRIPGIRELITINSAYARVNPNQASLDVLKALPKMSAELAASINSERMTKPFANINDIVDRVPELSGSDTLDFMSFDSLPPAELISRATISNSGVSRTVRLLFKMQETIRVITYSPYLYTRSAETVIDRWRFE